MYIAFKSNFLSSNFLFYLLNYNVVLLHRIHFLSQYNLISNFLHIISHFWHFSVTDAAVCLRTAPHGIREHTEHHVCCGFPCVCDNNRSFLCGLWDEKHWPLRAPVWPTLNLIQNQTSASCEVVTSSGTTGGAVRSDRSCGKAFNGREYGGSLMSQDDRIKPGTSLWSVYELCYKRRRNQ